MEFVFLILNVIILKNRFVLNMAIKVRQGKFQYEFL